MLLLFKIRDRPLLSLPDAKWELPIGFCGAIRWQSLSCGRAVCSPAWPYTLWGSARVDPWPLHAHQSPVRTSAGAGLGMFPRASGAVALWLGRGSAAWTGKNATVILTFLYINKGTVTMVRCTNPEIRR